MASNLWSEDQFSCSVCLELLKYPVAIPCGHSYCMRCIKNCWDQTDHTGVYSCPQCRETFTPRPVLGRNIMLTEDVGESKKRRLNPPPAQSYAGPGDVPCDFCTERKFKAVKSCLTCLVSYCETHVKPHYEGAAFKRHKLVNAIGNLEQKLCAEHQKVLEGFCRTDQTCICWLCADKEHKSHDTVSAETERTGKQPAEGAVPRGLLISNDNTAPRENTRSVNSNAADGIVCTGKQPGEDVQRNLGSNIMQQLCSQLWNTDRNITTDHFFTSVPLAEALLEKGLTLVGTLRQNKPDIPALMKASKSREVHSTEFGFKENTTMVSYLPKKGKAVILLSTMHHDMSVDEESEKKKPDVIKYYNGTKCDLMDQMVRTYYCKHQSRRCPMVLWYNALDRARLNTYLLYTSEYPEYRQGLTHKRCSFLQELKQLGEIQTEIQQRIQERLKEIEELKQSVELLKRSACIEIKESEKIFTELIRSIEKIHTKVIELIGANEKAAVNQAEGRMKKLEQEIAELRRRNAELKQLSETEDHIHFLQNFQSLCAPPEAGDLPSVTVYTDISFEAVRKAVSELKDHIEDFCKGELVKITTTDSCQLTLEPNTANRELCLSEGNRKVTRRRETQRYSHHPERFDRWAQVLCREGLSGTRCYWEIEWSGGGASIGVTYKGISRKGVDGSCALGFNDKSWSLYCSGSSYTARHNNNQTAITAPRSPRIGVYLDFNAGTLSFYGVSDTMTLLHRFPTTFTEPLYPGFWLHYCDSPVTICQLN
ncbi:UNVERIFIED_CONTAM: hypothetical protein FKN15_045186 [Acipenser sinensis]